MGGNPGGELGRTTEPFGVALDRLLASRELTLRGLARKVEVTPGHLSRVRRGVDGKAPSPALLRRIEGALDLPANYFREARRAALKERLHRDPRFVDELYDEHLGHGRERRRRAA